MSRVASKCPVWQNILEGTPSMRIGLFSVVFLAATAILNAKFTSEAIAEEPAAWAKANAEELVGLYRHFHAHPELSFEERETGARVAKELRATGMEVTEGVAKTGVVGLLKNGSGPIVMIRTDL